MRVPARPFQGGDEAVTMEQVMSRRRLSDLEGGCMAAHQIRRCEVVDASGWNARRSQTLETKTSVMIVQTLTQTSLHSSHERGAHHRLNMYHHVLNFERFWDVAMHLISHSKSAPRTRLVDAQ